MTQENRVEAGHRMAFVARVVLGWILIGLGVAAFFASPMARHCDADYDVVTCYADGSAVLWIAGVALIAVGVFALRSSRTTPARLIASASIAVVAVVVAVLVLADPRAGTTCDTRYYGPLLGPGESPAPIPTPNEDGLYCVDSVF